MIVALRTDKPEAELYLIDNGTLVSKQKWQAHRTLSDTLLSKCEELLVNSKVQLDQITGLIVFQGPGSFTGLRIGITAMNTMAYSLNIPIAGSYGDDWLSQGEKILRDQPSHAPITPRYGAGANITQPRK